MSGVRRDGGTIRRLEQTKTVSFLGGVCLLINSMTGPGIPFTASSFQSAGWMIPMALFFIFACVSSFSVLFIVEAMQAIPGNKHFQGTVEFSTLINFYFGPWEHLVGQFLLYGAIQSQAMQSIVLSAQGIDNLIIEIFKKTCGLTMPYVNGNGAGFQWICVDGSQLANGSGSPFGNTYMILTLGFLCVILLCIPLGMTNLDDNINIQIGAFIMTCVIIGQWMLSSILSGFNKHRVQPVLIQPGFANILGTIILNFSCTIFAPSWINLKQRTVNAQATVWTTSLLAIILYTGVGVFPALGYDLCQYSNVLPALVSSGVPLVLSKITAYAFSFVMLLPAIPVAFIVAQNNLTQNGLMNTTAATIVCKILPWILCIPMLTGPWLSQFINWSGIFLTSPANFVIPFVIYLKCLKFRTDYNKNRELTPKQKMLLKTIHYQSKTIANFIDAKTIDPKDEKLFAAPERTLRRGTVAMPSSLMRATSLLNKLYAPNSNENLRTPNAVNETAGVPLSITSEGPFSSYPNTLDSSRKASFRASPLPSAETNSESRSKTTPVPSAGGGSRKASPIPPTRHDSAGPESHHPPAHSHDRNSLPPPIRIDSANNGSSSFVKVGQASLFSPVEELPAVGGGSGGGAASKVRFGSLRETEPRISTDTTTRRASANDAISAPQKNDSQVTLDTSVTSPVNSLAGLLTVPPENHNNNATVQEQESEEPWLEEDVPDPEEEDRLAREQAEERGDERGLRKLLRAASTFRTPRSRDASRSRTPSPAAHITLSRMNSDSHSNGQGAVEGGDGLDHMKLVPLHNQDLKRSSAQSGVSDQSSSTRDSIPINSTKLENSVGIPPRLPSTTRFNSSTSTNLDDESELNVNEMVRADGTKGTSSADKAPTRKRKLARRGKEEEVWRRATLPYNPQFVAPAFRSVPRWLNIKPRTMAIGLMALTIFLSIGNVIIAALGSAGVGGVGGGGCNSTNLEGHGNNRTANSTFVPLRWLTKPHGGRLIGRSVEVPEHIDDE